MFMDKMKSVGNINLQISQQSLHLENIRKEISDLDIQKQKIYKETLLSAQILNSFYIQFIDLLESLKQIIIRHKNIQRVKYVSFSDLSVFPRGYFFQRRSRRK